MDYGTLTISLQHVFQISDDSRPRYKRTPLLRWSCAQAEAQDIFNRYLKDNPALRDSCLEAKWTYEEVLEHGRFRKVVE